jgi:hypothetical protein
MTIRTTSASSSTTSTPPSPACTPTTGELVGEVAQFGDTCRLCYVRDPAGIIVALAERLS